MTQSSRQTGNKTRNTRQPAARSRCIALSLSFCGAVPDPHDMMHAAQVPSHQTHSRIFVLLQLTATKVPHRGVAPAPFVHSELMLGQAPPSAKHNCTLFAAVEATLLLTLSTPVALVVLIVTFGVTDDPLRVADTTLPAHPRPT